MNKINKINFPLEVSVYQYNLLSIILFIFIFNAIFGIITNIGKFTNADLLFFIILTTSLTVIYIIGYAIFGVKKYIFSSDKIEIHYLFKNIKNITPSCLIRFSHKKYSFFNVIEITRKEDKKSSTKIIKINNNNFSLSSQEVIDQLKKLYNKN